MESFSHFFLSNSAKIAKTSFSWQKYICSSNNSRSKFQSKIVNLQYSDAEQSNSNKNLRWNTLNHFSDFFLQLSLEMNWIIWSSAVTIYLLNMPSEMNNIFGQCSLLFHWIDQHKKIPWIWIKTTKTKKKIVNVSDNDNKWKQQKFGNASWFNHILHGFFFRINDIRWPRNGFFGICLHFDMISISSEFVLIRFEDDRRPVRLMAEHGHVLRSRSVISSRFRNFTSTTSSISNWIYRLRAMIFTMNKTLNT